MLARQQPRRVARELSLLSLSQLSRKDTKLETLEQADLEALLLAATRTLSGEAHEILETAAAELNRSHDRLLNSETRAGNVKSAKAILEEAITLTETAINRIALAVDLPEMLQLAGQMEVRKFALELISTVCRRRQQIDEQLQRAMVDWQLSRLAKIDQDILRLAIAELDYLGVPQKVVINEAVELAKRYSGQDGHRFINGVLRRVVEQKVDPDTVPSGEPR
ncbi:MULTISPECIES: transcription antitermination factor NusB [unclassified Synechocystis]|uniref:transcription antitermination factor NusB n=1 Tax=unclassified Synechocystis TaxID=2640012 RepID=UPI0003FE20AF|nr:MULTISPECIES: transcription antitermination factor NusB [unclassified Synechocystis]AIE75996.1 Transcription termination protein NusB [Synechocystis sp. PCC 6714]MCT0255092.1 transcription antitermination factor NusB [Synechocystis sp. CS-94]